MSEWHGWTREYSAMCAHKESLHIGHLPHAKSVALYVLRGSVLTPLAYFANEELARQAMETLDRLTGGRP